MNVCAGMLQRKEECLCQAHSPHSPGGCDLGKLKVRLTVTTVLLHGGGGCTAGMTGMIRELWIHCSLGWHPTMVETNAVLQGCPLI